MYFGWYEASVTNLMKSILMPGDTFIDIGANIGYVTAIGAGLVGHAGEVHSFEPALPYFQRLEKLSKMNRDYRIIVNQYALGEEEKEANLLLCKENIGGNIIVSGGGSADSVKVLMHRFDKYAREKNLKNIRLIKIDVEAFEFPVLKGFSSYFNNTTDRPVIICEIYPSCYPCFGATLTEFLDYMKRYGYKTYSITDTEREIDITGPSQEKDHNIMFKAVGENNL